MFELLSFKRNQIFSIILFMDSIIETTQLVYQREWLWHATAALIFAALYLLYYLKFSNAHFLITGRYDTAKKNLRNPPPPYPNGWYNVAKTKQIRLNQVRAVDINGHNIVVYRGSDFKIYALEGYCKHMGANLGIGGEVVNQNCLRCPFHGWLYDGLTGQCVDHDGKPLELKSIEYNAQVAHKDGKLQWKQSAPETPTLRKYPAVELNGYIYVWIHAVEQFYQVPEYPMLDITNFIKNLSYRGQTEHHINCHLQDIPSNGADTLHFKYVHTYIFPSIQSLYLRWQAKWKTGDDPDLMELFEHPRKQLREFKQRIYKELIEPYPNKEVLSIGNLQNWVNVPIMGQFYNFSVTIIQVGLGIVFILIKGSMYELTFQHYIRPVGKNKHQVFHDAFISNYIPYFISSKILQFEGGQVTNDMYIWEAKSFARKTFLNESKESDILMKGWLKWSTQFYQGCGYQQEKEKLSW